MSRTWSVRFGTLCVLGALALSGCDSTLCCRNCTGEAEPAIRLTVENGATGEPVVDALAVATEGSYADSARTRSLAGSTDGAVATLGAERPGTYDVTVDKQGFRPWVRENVTAEAGACGPRTVELNAELTPR